MMSLPPSVRIFVAAKPADMRKSFDGLAALVREFLQADPLSGHLFVFRNRRGDRVKLLCWDSDGLLIVYKRLEEGVFRFPAAGDDATRVEIRASDLHLLLGGIDPTSVKRHKRYQRPAERA